MLSPLVINMSYNDSYTLFDNLYSYYEQAEEAEARRLEELTALSARFQSVLSLREARLQAQQEELEAAQAQLAVHTALLQQQHDQWLLAM